MRLINYCTPVPPNSDSMCCKVASPGAEGTPAISCTGGFVIYLFGMGAVYLEFTTTLLVTFSPNILRFALGNWLLERIGTLAAWIDVIPTHLKKNRDIVIGCVSVSVCLKWLCNP